jgi:hypothetical protein
MVERTELDRERYCWTGREGEEKSGQDYRWKEMHRDICT